MFEQQLGPFVLVQRPPDELTQQRALALGIRRTVPLARDAHRDEISLLFKFDELLVATLPPAVTAETVTVGRLPDCDVVVDDPSVSKRHARLAWSEAGWTIEDLGSSNGTWLNREAIRGVKPLRDADEVRFGDARFLVLRTASLYERLLRSRAESPPTGQ